MIDPGGGYAGLWSRDTPAPQEKRGWVTVGFIRMVPSDDAVTHGASPRIGRHCLSLWHACAEMRVAARYPPKHAPDADHDVPTLGG